MGFRDYYLYSAPYFEKGSNGYQIDLLFERTDKIVVLAKMKYSKQMISTKVVPEVDRKVDLFKKHTGNRIQKALISIAGPNQALRDTEYFDYYVKAEDLFRM